MFNQRKLVFAVMAWVLPLVMLASWSAQAVGMLCRMDGAVVRSGCCCGASPAVAATPASEIADAGCCEVSASKGPAVVPVVLPLIASLPPVEPVLFAQLVLPEPQALPPGRWAPAQLPHVRGTSLPLLKHSFLI